MNEWSDSGRTANESSVARTDSSSLATRQRIALRSFAKRVTSVIRALVLVTLFTFGSSEVGIAQTARLEGSWTGGGPVTFASGQTEQARCRAHYTRRSEASYFVRATCATASGKAAQTAILRKAAANSYRGRFYNREYDISGQIFVVLNGNRQSVRLTSASGSAFIQLRR